MFFRNLTFFRFPPSLNAALDTLEDRLVEHPLKPVGPLELGSRGFVAPMGGEGTRRLLGAGAGFFPMFNRNKRSIGIDLKQAAGASAAPRMAMASSFGLK